VKMKLSIHQMAALWWLATGTAMFLPLVALSPKPDAGLSAWIIIASVTAVIAIVPVALHWPVFKRLFCWTDALTIRERDCLKRKDDAAFGRAAREDGYAKRIKPYLYRIGAVFCLIAAGQEILPESLRIVRGAFDAVGWYICGVLLLNLALLFMAVRPAKRKT